MFRRREKRNGRKIRKRRGGNGIFLGEGGVGSGAGFKDHVMGGWIGSKGEHIGEEGNIMIKDHWGFKLGEKKVKTRERLWGGGGVLGGGVGAKK